MLQRSPEQNSCSQKAIVTLTFVNADERVDADVLEGYYMIGRDRECQIRPKSTSVSERHCLLEHRVGLLRIFDLKSCNGTFINGHPLEPMQWRFLKHGDAVRCGKVEFKVSIQKNSDYVSPESMSKTGQETAAKIETAGEFDFAALADSFADVSIDIASGPVKLTNNTADKSEIVDDLFAEQVNSTNESEAKEGKSASSEPLTKAEEKLLKKERKRAAKAEAKQLKLAEKKAESGRAPKLKAIKPARVARSFGGSSFSIKDSEKIKILVAFVLAASIVTFFGYQIYQFTQPNQTRIIQDQYEPTIEY